MALRRLGIDKEPIESMISTFQSMKHYLRTAYGDSEEFYDSENEIWPFHGVGQGNGWAPAIWTAISTVLFDILRGERMGSVIESAITRRETTFTGFAIVDDVDLVSIGSLDDTIEDVRDKM